MFLILKMFQSVRYREDRKHLKYDVTNAKGKLLNAISKVQVRLDNSMASGEAS